MGDNDEQQTNHYIPRATEALLPPCMKPSHTHGAERVDRGM